MPTQRLVRVPISRRALIQRINRRLAKEYNQSLRVTREGNSQLTLGDYFIVDLRLNAVVARRVDLEEFGREIGVLKPWEFFVQDVDA